MRFAPAAAAAGVLLWLTIQGGLPAHRPQSERRDAESGGADADAVVDIEFGLVSGGPREWEGSLTVSGGRILSLEGRHFVAPGDWILPSGKWAFSTRPMQAPVSAAKGGPPPMLPNGVSAAVNAPDTARITAGTNRGSFSFTLGELKKAGRLSFLEGDAAAVYAPPAPALTQGDGTQHDFPSTAAWKDDLFVVWTAFQNEANLVYLAHRRGDRWSVYRMSPAWGDYYGSAVAVDGEGRAHAIWSEYRDDRWRIVSRQFDPVRKRLGDLEYPGPGGRRQIFPRAAADSRGTLWAAWQEFAGTHWEIRVASRAGGRWSPPLSLGEPPSNQWAPALTAAPDGTVWVAWDGYQGGNYDIYLRAVRDGKPQRAMRVTRAPGRDANPSIAVDPANRVWIAWEEGGGNWGKDFGVLGRPAAAIHQTRRVRLACYRDGGLFEPSVPLWEALPRWLADYQGYPHLAIGPNGLPYVFFSHLKRLTAPASAAYTLRMGSEENSFTPRPEVLEQAFDRHAAGFDGAGWLPVRRLPRSWGRCSVQMGTALAGGKLFTVWPIDGRSFEERRVESSQLRYCAFDFRDRAAARDGSRPFVSAPDGSPDAAPTEARDLAAVRAVRWGETPPLRLFRGELHRHTDISTDGRDDGDVLDAYRYAIDAAALDFMAVTEHSFHERLNYFRYDWWRSRQVTSMFNNPGRFVTFYGYERTVKYPGGHRNVVSTRRGLQTFPIDDEENFGVQSYAERFYPELKRHGDIAIAHTTSGPGGTRWPHWDGGAEPLVEVFQGLRGAFDEPDGPAARKTTARADGYVWSAWAKGFRPGVIASSDHTSTHQSYACVYATALTRESLFEAFRSRLAFAATDNIVVKFSAARPEGGRYKMGREFRTGGRPRFFVEIRGTGRLTRVELIRNGRVVLARTPEGPEERFTYRDDDPPRRAYYCLRVQQADGMLAWSSPIWVDPAR